MCMCPAKTQLTPRACSTRCRLSTPGQCTTILNWRLGRAHTSRGSSCSSLLGRCEAGQLIKTPIKHLSYRNRRSILSSIVWIPTTVVAGNTVCLQDDQERTEQTVAYKARFSSADYTKPGPFRPHRCPRLEHTCASCFPQCVGSRCMVKIDITYPKGGGVLGVCPPYPLVIFNNGFLVGSDSYQSYANRLASWGYTVLLYDKVEVVTDTLDDEVSVRMIRDIMDWCSIDPIVRQLADPRRVYMVGHSRGGKLAALAAAADPRVAALCLLDPVDNTQYAPLGPGYPSAVAALSGLGAAGRPPPPTAIVGAGIPGDCVPRDANYDRFFEASHSATWEVVLRDAGHFQFLDSTTPLQRVVCPEGETSDPLVRDISQAVMVAWAEATVRQQPLGVALDARASPGAATVQERLQRMLLGLQYEGSIPLYSRFKNMGQLEV